MSRLVVLDNEAVVALKDPEHRKHRRVLSHIQVVVNRKRRGVVTDVVVPTAVRVEAGWDRTSPAWALANHLRITDRSLDAAHTNVAAAKRIRTSVSVADAHMGAVIHLASADQIAVITSDPSDMELVAGDSGITIITI